MLRFLLEQFRLSRECELGHRFEEIVVGTTAVQAAPITTERTVRSGAHRMPESMGRLARLLLVPEYWL
jgi:hypothetical protein